MSAGPGRGAQLGSGGLRSTGQTGLNRAVPCTPEREVGNVVTGTVEGTGRVVDVTFVVLDALVVTVVTVVAVAAVVVVVASGPGTEVVLTGVGTDVVFRRLRAREKVVLVPQAPARIVTTTKARVLTRRLSITPSCQNNAAVGARGDAL